MFGDLKKVLTDEFLDSIDVFSAWNEQFVGHFTILRNGELMNRAGFQIDNWQRLCVMPETKALDEIRFCEAVKKMTTVRRKHPQSLECELASDCVACGVTFSFYGRIADLDKTAVPLIEWNDGRVLFHGEDGRTREVLYVHFMATKHWWHWLFWRTGSPSQSSHYFSRVGYGGPTSVMSLRTLRWRSFYFFQSGLTWAKISCGTLLKRVLPSSTFLRVRRKVFSLARSRSKAMNSN